MNRRKFFGLLATTAVSSVVLANSEVELIEDRDKLIFKPEPIQRTTATRVRLAEEMGRNLAIQMDKNIMKALVEE